MVPRRALRCRRQLGACWPLADITLDWILDGAVRAGAVLRAESPYAPTATPTELDALTDGARTISLRSLPPDARVHASVDVYLRAHPEYWRRLPAEVVWADTDWLARSERLVRTAAPKGLPSSPMRWPRSRRSPSPTE